ncbi:hypothetical protein FSP39_015688 [Pinctada imbricata]|uniref:G-protein coupled receptors family 1 profile domain-containing protein n=1 Tax=Pinctada imbricata TaxID=66713 RepID=A0AA88YJI9_PINIB|nr:hypothetical protein FSP39_015688 [Pinctada imbricata]
MEENLMTIYNISKQENCSLPSQHSNYSAKLSLLSTPEARAVPAVFALVFICGILGNFTLLYFVLRKILINSPQTVYIMNLAVGDILMISVAMPFVSIIYTLEEWPFGEIISANPLVFFLLESRFRRFVVNCYLCQSRSTGTESRAQGIAVPHQTIILTDLISGEKTDAI